MKLKFVKQSTLITIAVLIAFLVILPRLLELFQIFGSISASFDQVSVSDVLTRFIMLLIYTWLGLQLNANGRYRIFQFSKPLNSLLTVLANVLLFFAAVFGFFFIHQISTGSTLDTADRGMIYFVYFIILIIAVFIARILRFQIIHRDDLAEKELLKQQSLQNELNALKNQINPHFLFNALNSLNSLVRENEEATTFVNELAYMYRYILQSGQQDLVSLKDELKFLNSYIHLIKVRYRDRVSFDIAIPESQLTKAIPSLTLQLLAENAIKHNEISEAHPLEVKLYFKDDLLVIENKIRPRTTLVQSTGHGLENINKRYMLLLNAPITITQENELFFVKLPLI